MYKPSKGAGLRALSVAALTLWAPLCATAGVTTTESKEPARPVAPAAQTAKAAAYQMRCWQYGKLLFEENLASLPSDGSQYSLKVSGTDRNGHPVYVAETKNATCLIRNASGERGWSAGVR